MHRTAHGVPAACAFAFLTQKGGGRSYSGVAGRQLLLESLLSFFYASRSWSDPWPLGNDEHARSWRSTSIQASAGKQAQNVFMSVRFRVISVQEECKRPQCRARWSTITVTAKGQITSVSAEKPDLKPTRVLSLGVRSPAFAHYQALPLRALYMVRHAEGRS